MVVFDRLLILEDNPADAELAERNLRKAGLSFVAVRVQTKEDFLQQLEQFDPDIILADYIMPSFDGMTALKLASEHAPRVPVVMYTGSVNEETAVKCLKAGAADYVLKSQETRLAHAVEGALERAREKQARERTEELLRSSEAKYRNLIENANFGIYTASVAGRFLSVNAALVEMLGYGSREELLEVDLGRDVYVDPSERQRVLKKHLLEGYRVFEEVNWKRKNGERITVRINGRAVHDEDGQVQFFEAIAEDVTERHRLEAQLRQAQKMEAIGQITGGIAHDFNNELSVILLNVQMLADRLERGETRVREELQDIGAAASRATEMTRRLVGFSRRAALTQVPTDLARRVRKLSTLFKRVLPETISVQTHADDSVASVLVDPNSVEQILLNLVTNARHAMPDSGTLTVKVWEAELDEVYCGRYAPMIPGRYVLVEVSDTGAGMDHETRSRIFEPFFTTKTPGEGTGLGMSMVYGLTKQQNGFVHVDSEPGCGTTVRLAFPALDLPAATTAEHEAVVAEDLGGTETILLVEDEEALRRVGSRVLESRGYTVITACDGEDALEIYRSKQHHFDLVISDLIMPKMGGAELCKILRAEDKELPTMLTSGHSDSDVRERMKVLRNVPLIQKPWTVEEMLRSVRKVLDKAQLEGVRS